jgi:hypothetical protein
MSKGTDLNRFQVEVISFACSVCSKDFEDYSYGETLRELLEAAYAHKCAKESE